MRSRCRTIGLNYMYTRSEQEKKQEKGMPIIVANDNKTNVIMAKVVPSKGGDNHALERVEKMVEHLGYRKVIMRSDSEQAILAKEAVGRERERDVEILLEEVPVGDHQANGLVENAAKNARGQFRVIR
jgi:hypothetical protein